tara:strand:+ start:226 stop:1050 length:825 start_codon:yes stop_codon:yes gene_type:complete
MKTLIAGPWVGEFGWELFAWHAYIRALSREFDKTLIISRENSRALYDDFADDFIAYEPSGGLADAFFMHNLDIKKTFKDIITEHQVPLNKETALIIPRRIGFPPHTHHTQHILFGNHLVQPEYVCLGEEAEREYDYVFHLRSRELRQEDNWSVENWQQLKDLLGDKKIACIGTLDESGHIDGTTDLRGTSLKNILTILHNAECAFGSSSGPMHLASLCGLSHVVWSLNANKVRYEENWNPLNTPVLFNSDYNWHPTPQYIFEKFLHWRKENGNK